MYIGGGGVAGEGRTPMGFHTHMVLSHARLPIPPPRLKDKLSTIKIIFQKEPATESQSSKKRLDGCRRFSPLFLRRAYRFWTRSEQLLCGRFAELAVDRIPIDDPVRTVELWDWDLHHGFVSSLCVFCHLAFPSLVVWYLF